MYLFGIILSMIIGGVWVFGSVAMMFSSWGKSGWRRWLMLVGSGLMLIGALGFFGSAFSACGGLNWLPDSFEWPVGYANGVLHLDNQLYVVPHTPSDRVQIYDAQWKFVKGWYVDAGGGTFKLVATGPSQFDVITSRGQNHYVYDTTGKLLSSTKYSADSYGSFPDQGESYFVPTSPWFWVWSNPFYSWACAMVGMMSLLFVEKYKAKR